MILGSENAYGMTIHEQVEKLAARVRAVSLGSVYTTLDRLEQKGHVKSWFGGATKQRGGRSKRFFEITGELRVEEGRRESGTASSTTTSRARSKEKEQA